MSKKTATVEKLPSRQMIEKLDTALGKGNMEQLKKHMEKLLTFKNIYDLHDDHIIELAECMIDLHRADNPVECANEIESYVMRRIGRYQERKEKAVKELQWAKATKTDDEVKMLDLSYRLWVYESGFEYSKYRMYMMQRAIAQKYRKQAEDGKK